MYSSSIFILFSIFTSVYSDIPYPVERPTPYSPNYSPECALIVTANKPALNGEPVVKLSPGLQYISNYVPNLKRSGYYPEEGQVCITYEDINKAVYEAKEKTGGYLPQEVHELSSDLPKASHVGIAAEILSEVTRTLARWYHLSKETILFGLPRIDTYKTAVRDICPTFLQPVKCELSKYRTLTGMCNNLEYPSWGSARSAMVRFLPPAYADGISEPRRSYYDHSPLPSARLVSFYIHHDISERDYQTTSLFVAYGQLIDHDMTFGALTQNELGKELKCCDKPPHLRHPACLPIDIPHDDPFYKFFKRTCMNFVRVIPGLKPGCPLGPRSQINVISGIIDANFVYGSNQEVASRIRDFQGGRLKTSPLYRELGLKDLLPMKTTDPDAGCERTGRKNLFCFDAGDNRASETITLAVFHTLFLREHNRIAAELSYINPHWDDETLYQETRRIIAAINQHLTFNEYLPVVLGREIMSKYGLDLVQDGYYYGYDPKINSGIRVGFQAAAFRFGHSQLPDTTDRYNKFHQKLEAIRLSQLLKQPYELYKPGIVDTFIVGMLDQVGARMDSEITTEVTNHLFEKPGDHFGLDLAAINIQRGREMGLPGYNAFREYCGLPRAKTFYDLSGNFDNRTIHRFATIYKAVDDIDLWTAGIAEYPLPGAFVGPTFACIIGEQFANLRRGDRFWYENNGWPSSFTVEQLNEIRKAKMAKLICDNSDDLGTIQLYPMLAADPHSNPRVDCTELPAMDLSKWADTEYKSKAKA